MEFQLFYKDLQDLKGNKIKVLDEKKTLTEWHGKLENFKTTPTTTPATTPATTPTTTPTTIDNKQYIKSLISDNIKHLESIVNENKKQTEGMVNENKKQTETQINVNIEQLKNLISGSERKERNIKELRASVEKLTTDNKKLCNNQVKLLKRLEKLEREQKSEISSVPEF